MIKNIQELAAHLGDVHDTFASCGLRIAKYIESEAGLGHNDQGTVTLTWSVENGDERGHEDFAFPFETEAFDAAIQAMCDAYALAFDNNWRDQNPEKAVLRDIMGDDLFNTVDDVLTNDQIADVLWLTEARWNSGGILQECEFCRTGGPMSIDFALKQAGYPWNSSVSERRHKDRVMEASVWPDPRQATLETAFLRQCGLFDTPWTDSNGIKRYGKKRKQTATLPDGRVASRTSDRVYRWVVCVQDDRNGLDWNDWYWTSRSDLAEEYKSKYLGWSVVTAVQIVPVDDAPKDPGPPPSKAKEDAYTPPPADERWTNCLAVKLDQPTRFFYKGYVLQNNWTTLGQQMRREWHRPDGTFVMSMPGDMCIARMVKELRRAIDAILDGSFADLYPRQCYPSTAPQQHDRGIR